MKKETNWKELDKKINEAILRENKLYHELIKKGVLIEHEDNSSRIKLEPNFEFEWE